MRGPPPALCRACCRPTYERRPARWPRSLARGAPFESRTGRLEYLPTPWTSPSPPSCSTWASSRSRRWRSSRWAGSAPAAAAGPWRRRLAMGTSRRSGSRRRRHPPVARAYAALAAGETGGRDGAVGARRRPAGAPGGRGQPADPAPGAGDSCEPAKRLAAVRLALALGVRAGPQELALAAGVRPLRAEHAAMAGGDTPA